MTLGLVTGGGIGTMHVLCTPSYATHGGGLHMMVCMIEVYAHDPNLFNLIIVLKKN